MIAVAAPARGQALATVAFGDPRLGADRSRLTLPLVVSRIVSAGTLVVVETDAGDVYAPQPLEYAATGELVVRLAYPPAADARRATVRRAQRNP